MREYLSVPDGHVTVDQKGKGRRGGGIDGRRRMEEGRWEDVKGEKEREGKTLKWVGIGRGEARIRVQV